MTHTVTQVKLLPSDPGAIWKRNKHRIETEKKNGNLQTQQPPPVRSSWSRPCRCGVSQSRYRHRQITFKATFLRFPIIVNFAAGWVQTKVCAKSRGIETTTKKIHPKFHKTTNPNSAAQALATPKSTNANLDQYRAIWRARVASCLGVGSTGHWLRFNRPSVYYCCNKDTFRERGTFFPMQFSHPTRYRCHGASVRATLFGGTLCVSLGVWRRVTVFFCSWIWLWFEGRVVL